MLACSTITNLCKERLRCEAWQPVAAMGIRIVLAVQVARQHTEVEGDTRVVSLVRHGVMLARVAPEADSLSWLELKSAEVALAWRALSP